MPVLVVVDDDDEYRAQLVRDCRKTFRCSLRNYSGLCEASKSGRVDVLLVDTSAMSSGHWSFTASGLAKFMSEHPSAEIFIQSGMSTNAVRNLIEDLQDDYHMDTTKIFAAGFQWDSVRDCLLNKSELLTRK